MIYKMGQVIRMIDISSRRIIEYEKMGLLKPLREQKTNDRLFTDFEIKQIKKIRDLVHIHGFTLKSIVYLLNIAPCWRICDCKKYDCPVYNKIEKKCWQVTAANQYCYGDCQRCAIYLSSKKFKKIRLLEKPVK